MPCTAGLLSMRWDPIVLSVCLLLPAVSGCMGGQGSISVDVDNSEQNNDGRISYTAVVTVTVDGYSGEREDTVDVPENRATLLVEPSLEEGSVEVTVTGPDGAERFSETLTPSTGDQQQDVVAADGTWSVAMDADEATGTVRVELA